MERHLKHFNEFITTLSLYLDLQKDAYTKTGCINLLCSGFVQTTTKFSLGAAIEPVSRAWGEQYYIAVSMYLVTFYGLYNMVLSNFCHIFFSLNLT